jgi:hypothetical protein
MAGRIGGFLHLAIGEEAAVVGTVSAMRADDPLTSTYREHGQALARGADPRAVMAELLGRSTGLCGGRGGSMHLMDKARSFYGGYGIVGGSVPLGLGLAYAARYRKTDQVSVTMFGDGATNQGVVAECFNMAGLWDLPVVFVCENNHCGMGTAEWRAAKSPTFYTRGDYIPGLKVGCGRVAGRSMHVGRSGRCGGGVGAPLLQDLPGIGIVGGKAHHHAVIHVAPLGVVVAFCNKGCGCLHKRHGILKRGKNIGSVQGIFVLIPKR